MAKFELIYDRPGETPMYLGSDDDVGGNDAAINAALPEVPVGTVITTAGFGTMKQLGSDGHWATLNTGGGGGSGLPDYSEASEGDVLSIDSNGDPAWAPPSGGGGNVLVVETTNSSGTYSDATATSTEIYAAADAGALPVLLIHNYFDTDTMPLYYAGVSADGALFTTIFPGSTFAIDSAGHVTMQ